jgi:antitoxin YefM
MKALTYTAARESLAATMNSVCRNRAPVIITRKRDQSVVMLSLEDYESLEETAYLLRSPANARRLLRGGLPVLAGNRSKDAPANSRIDQRRNAKSLLRHRQARAASSCAGRLLVATDHRRAPHGLSNRRRQLAPGSAAIPLQQVEAASLLTLQAGPCAIKRWRIQAPPWHTARKLSGARKPSRHPFPSASTARTSGHRPF